MPLDSEPAFYTIRLKGHLDPGWSEWFDGLTLTHAEGSEGETILSGMFADQCVLHGLLARIRDLNLVILSIVKE